ncbi:hypothetical protein EVJ20_11150 [Exiguobacterium sp. SH0S1]|uniref:SH3 domain-containing protein n=1 Tax=Exiguobacterium sp. SH0S1 TaxID=2510949 RepID=UPI00103F7B24|nr:SH3 domain-containing protein [Exiguobacterium sp. SH0S1]TCI76507.1 hypothetical protein EVJ20_11150 [Exiguobacterium sp. SH0S1]
MKPTITRLSAAVLISSTVLSMIGPSESYAATYEGTVNTSILNVRSSTSTSAAIVGKLTKGTAVQVYSTSNNWAQIEFQGQKRYVSSSYLTLKELDETSVSTIPTYTTTENVNLRSSYSRTAPIMTTIPKNSNVEYLSTHGANGSWYRIKFGTRVGYVAAAYVSNTNLNKASVSAPNNSFAPYQLTLKNIQMRSNFVSSAPVVLSVPKNEAVKVISAHGSNGTWYKIEYKGKSGYVAKWDVTHNDVYVIKNARLFTSPLSTSKVIQELPIGTKVSYVRSHGRNGTWYEVKYGNTTGYIAKWDVSVDSNDVQKETSLYSVNSTNMHASTISSSPVLATIPQGAKVTYHSKHGANGTWFKISYNGATGYSPAWDFSQNPPAISQEQYGTERFVEIRVNQSPYTLNVREKPDSSSNSLGTLATNTVVKTKPVLTTEWGIITDGDHKGRYIHLGYTIPSNGISKVVKFTEYPYSANELSTIQVAAFGQTDLYRDKPAYIPRAYLSVNGAEGIITKKEMTTLRLSNLEKDPKATPSPLLRIPTGSTVEGVGRVQVGKITWLKVRFGTTTGYVQPRDLLGTTDVLTTTNNDAPSYGKLHTGEKVKVTGQIGNFYTIEYSRPSGYNIQVYDQVWRRASAADIEPYVNPSNVAQDSQAFYQFLDLSKSAGTTATTLNKVLTNSGTLTAQGQAFITAANQYGVNEIYLLAHAVHETGHGKSRLAQGVPVDKDGNALINSNGTRIYPDREEVAKVYNMYGIQAVDSSPLATGAKFAFNQGWTTPYKAIVGGAKWIGASYINHPTYKQNTLYKMRFNPATPGVHQYATDIGWATKQTSRIYQTYQSLDSYTLHFDVPKFQ